MFTLTSAQMGHRAWLWYSQPRLVPGCCPLSTPEKSTECISPRSCLLRSESSIHLRLPSVTLAVTGDRCCIFAHPPSSSVPYESNTSLLCGGPSPPATEDAMADCRLSAQGPHHMMTKGTLRRQAHPVLQVDFNVSVHQADLWQALFSMWPTSCTPPPNSHPPVSGLHQPKPGKDSSADKGQAVSQFSLLVFSCPHASGRAHSACASQNTRSDLQFASPHSLPLPDSV